MIERPRFRTDLVAEPIDDGGLRFIDVLDPDSGNGFRFFEIEYSIACAMDGERDVAGLVRWAREELGVEPSAKEIGTVITTLGELGYLEGEAAEAPALDEPELVRGVVAAAPEPIEPVHDFDLGTAGQPMGRPVDEMPAADDLELGTAGPSRAAEARDAFGSGPDVAVEDVGGLGPAGGREFDTPTPPPPEMPSATLRPVAGRSDAEEDGPTNLPQPRTMDFEDDEVSVDLSDHLAISADDVKAAVRASKVMAAVDVPKDVLEQLEADESRAREDAAAAAAAREQAAAEAAAREAEQAATAAREQAAREALAREAALSAERTAAAEAARQAALAEAAAREQAAEAAAREAAEAAAAAREQAARPVSELPQIPVGVSRKRPPSETKEAVKDAAKPATPVEAPARGARRAVWLLLVLAIVIAGAYYVWTKVLKKPLPWEAKDEVAENAAPPGPAQPTQPAQPAQPPQPPPPPPPPVAPLAEKAGEVSNIVAGQAAVLSFVIADGTTVQTGDPILRFAGNAADERKMEGYNYDIEKRYPKQIEDATKIRDRAAKVGPPAVVKAQDAKIAEVQKKLDQRKAERDALAAKLDGLTIKAPIAGVVKLAPGVAKGTRTTADQSVASVTAPSTLQAVFTVKAGGKTYSADASVRVAVKATPDQKANCTATSVEGAPGADATVTVTCPADSGIAAGTELVLE